MLDWFSHILMSTVTYVPALIVAPDSPKFFLVRAMFGLLLIILFLYLIAMRAELWALVRRLLDACAGKYGGSER